MLGLGSTEMLLIIIFFAAMRGFYIIGRGSHSKKNESTVQRFDSNTYIPQDKRVFRPDEESKIVEEWEQFQQDRMKPYFEALSRGEITPERVDRAIAECPSFRDWLKKHHPDAFNWMKYIPD